MPGWKFITNHALVLCFLAKQPNITARELSTSINVTEKTTLAIISDLESEGYVRKKREGRRLRYSVNPDLPLRIEHQESDIGCLLELLGWERHVLPVEKELVGSARQGRLSPV